MGEHRVETQVDLQTRTAYIRHLLNDLKALERMLEEDLIENDVVRIGAEQEFCLLTPFWRPSKKAIPILEKINCINFTSELAKYNLEINLDPLELRGNCFSEMHQTLKQLVKRAEMHATDFDDKVLLTGILPTISKDELQMDYMTPNPRYWRLNEMIKAVRGKDIQLYLRGVDELYVKHDSVLFEACNTSFQMHLQVPSHDFVNSFNWAQAISGPVLAIATNSPLLLGKELWSETRIGLFQQSIDTRVSSYTVKEQLARVNFGLDWEQGTIVDIYKNDIAQFKILMANPIEEDALKILDEGSTPKLKALCLHNGTVYRWNRACYGVGGGKPHLRIENRYIPSGPTMIDEIANFVFWVGLMHGRPAELDDFTNKMQFLEAKANFYKAARSGKESILNWMGEKISVQKLVIEKLIPMAKSGLEKLGIHKQDISKYLGIISARTKGNTGSQWMKENYRKLRKVHKKEDALILLTKNMYRNQQRDIPVSSWPPANENETLAIQAKHLVSHIMSTHLFTINRQDLANLAFEMMHWKNIHHLLVEGHDRKLMGILIRKDLEYALNQQPNSDLLVEDVMIKSPKTIDPNTTIREAIRVMETKQIDCLPVVEKENLVGIVTLKDLAPYLG